MCYYGRRDIILLQKGISLRRSSDEHALLDVLVEHDVLIRTVEDEGFESFDTLNRCFTLDVRIIEEFHVGILRFGFLSTFEFLFEARLD